MNFAKFLRTLFLQNTSGGCFCTYRQSYHVKKWLIASACNFIKKIQRKKNSKEFPEESTDTLMKHWFTTRNIYPSRSTLNLKWLTASACNFIRKETLTQVFSCGFCEISKNTFFYRTPLVAVSAHGMYIYIRLNKTYFTRKA